MKSDQGGASVSTLSAAEYSFGPFRLDVKKRRVWKGDQLIALTPKAFDTLLVLLRQAGQVVDRDDLLQIVWPDTFVTEETLTQNIATIRRALGDSSDHPQYIATIPRRGYQFIAVARPASTDRPQSGSALAAPGTEVVPDTVELPASRRRESLLIGVATLAVLLSVGLVVAYYLRPMSRAKQLGDQWQINPPAGTTLVSAGVLSPDGRSVAFATIDKAGTRAIWVQALGSLESLRLPGTEQGGEPFWSADGSAIAFTADRKLKRISFSDKTPQTLGEVASFQHRGGAWSPGGVILHAAKDRGPLYQLRDNGTFEPVTRLEAGERVHLSPSFLPDGRRFLYRAVAFDDRQSGTYLASLDSTERTRVLDGSTSAAVYAPPGYLVFVREGALVAQRFDAERRRLEGAAVVVAPNVPRPNEDHGLTFSVADDIVSYVSGGAHRQLAWFDRDGRPLGVLEGSIDLNTPTLSPDDARVLAIRPKADWGNQIWMAPTASGAPWPFDTGLPQGGLSVWSHDGESVAFTSAADPYRASASGGRVELLMKAPTPEQPLRVQDWSSDDRFLVYYTPHPKTGGDLWWYSIADKHAKPFLQSPADEWQAQLSPDGNWIAYASNESGQFEVWVQSFPTVGSKRKISASGGAQPQWRQDGRELFYLTLENTLMSVEVQPGSPPVFGAPRSLFHIALNESLMFRRNHYAVSRDGRRFLFSAPRPIEPPITVRLKWREALQPR